MILTRLLFPPKCILCRRILENSELDLCHNCRIEAPECPASRNRLSFLDSWAAIWYYEDLVRASLLRYKFRSARAYAPAYGRLLAMKLLQQHPEGFDLLTWVPISRLRRWKRGFDQVELLATYVGAELGMTPQPLLKKIRHNRPQSGIHGDAKRRANVLGVYQVTDHTAVAGKRILLLDDIVTTGATAGECARVLLTAGAKEVHLGAVAAARHKAKSR